MPSPKRIPPYVLLLLPAVSFILLMYLYPFVTSFVGSLKGRGGEFTFDNFSKVAELYLNDIRFTFILTLSNTLFTGLLAVSIAIYLRLRDNKVSRLISGVCKFPIFIPFVVVAQMMNSFLAPHGLLNMTLASLGLLNLDKPLQFFNYTGLTIGFLWKLVPFAILIIYGGFQMIDNSYIEAARNSGANLFKLIIRILIPMNRSSILVALVLVYSQIMGTFTLPYMLIGGKSPTTITVDIAHRVTYFRDFGVANSLGIISYLLVLLAALYYLRVSVKEKLES